MRNSQMVVSNNPTVRHFVRAPNGTRFVAFDRKDADKLAAKLGGKVVSVPANR